MSPYYTRVNKTQKAKRVAWEKRHRHLCWVNPETNDVHLTVELKRQILKKNIYGVDIDSAAVEVTQLSLYLKMLENENQTTIDRQRELLADKDKIALLPPLEDNIKCGNSIIASDFSEEAEDLVRVNAFDWGARFGTIINAGGFDAVVGNPPWIDIKGFDPTQTRYLFEAYSTVENRMNVYAVFMHRSMDLLKTNGILGFITPNSFLTQSSYEKLRDKLLSIQVVTVVRTPDNVFDGVAAETAISIYRMSKPTAPVEVIVYPSLAKIELIAAGNGAKHQLISQADWCNGPSRIFNLHLTAGVNALLKKLGQAARLC